MRAAFDHVVSQHGPAVLRVCRALVGPDDADDAWADSFLSAMRAYPDLPDDANVEAWLVTIARRRCVDHLRARARRALPVEALPERPATQAVGVAERLDLYSALAALPTKQRESVALHHLGGLPYAEVAALLGGTEAAARRAAADGTKALRAALADQDQDVGSGRAPRTTQIQTTSRTQEVHRARR
ncbi:RNA polymerase sigma factor, sigma-70 family [Sanguibacter keddieii DSM 10542]|uniref:RNA polymerase sigma factor, sigma-70 family n=1 Tax=Sanguibacter keddieii (strain ATCC 51767 / DSM 10542 / NCFB 3025 / ST-74) TaxID=446469 RepID=D1BCR6_SANKS|nr:RNA polymerase sigma factor [Sanguibacter keddieii]ACZ20914.1 RNA polymerase sigma factor, sigma-70 family [Sanguibacter keddieii DSM 10542]